MSGRKKRPASSSASTKSTGKRIRVGAVRIKEDPDSSSTSNNDNNNPIPAAATSMPIAPSISKDQVRERFLSMFESAASSGISNTELKLRFRQGDEYQLLVDVINDLLQESRLHMSKSGDNNELFYTLVDAEVAQKYHGLDVSARMVLQVIEKAENNGIWTKDIRLQTNIQQQALNKIFKLLEQRRLIKPVKSVTAKTKKLYMLYELTPSKELTGGVWYSGLEFDHEFISELRNFVMHCVRGTNGGKGVTLDEIMQLMAQHNVSKVKLNVDEMKQLVETLVYDYHLEATSVNENGDQVYTRARPITAHCDFKWWDILSPDFPFRAIKFEDEVTLQPHEPHHHTV